ncbi:MAG: CocE/NonD family hydrolase [Galactobacter sp.]
MRDGVRLAADLYAPAAPSKGVILVRTPYGRGTIMSLQFARVWAGQGYTVLYVASRGTDGCEGTFDPMRTETEDGHDVIDWLRGRPFYPGSFATFGHSYLGYAQWAILEDPPEDLVAAVVMEGPHDFARHAWDSGSFHGDQLGWAAMVETIHSHSVKDLAQAIKLNRSPERVLRSTPVIDEADKTFADASPWLHERLVRSDLDDPYVASMRHARALEVSTVPTLIIAGWQDIFLPQSIEQYQALAARGVETRLIAGAWTHTDMDNTVVRPAVLDWLDSHLKPTQQAAATGSAPAQVPDHGVDVELTPTGTWRHLTTWPPEGSTTALYPGPDHQLTSAMPVNHDISFVFDPADPTPSIGGNELSKGGYREDTSVAKRDDVLHFDTPPLENELTIMGSPKVQLNHRTDLPDADVFVRVSDVDESGRSTNVTDAYVRVVGEHDCVQLDMHHTAHVFAAGHRIRLLVAGGWFPYYSRNSGTGENPLTAATFRPNRHRITFGPGTVLELPTVEN